MTADDDDTPDPHEGAREIRFTDRNGLSWTVVEYRTEHGQRKRVPFRNLPMGAPGVEGRAFVPDGWIGDVMLYRFGVFAYRDIQTRTLREQLDAAHRVGASPRERMEPRLSV